MPMELTDVARRPELVEEGPFVLPGLKATVTKFGVCLKDRLPGLGPGLGHTRWI